MCARISEIKTELRHGLSPLRWAHDHPWLALAASAAGGFATATALIPSKEQQELARLRRIQEALHPAPKPAPDHKDSKKSEAKEVAIGALLLRQIIGLIRPAIVSLLSAALTARPKPSEPNPQAAPAIDPSDRAPIPPL